MQGREDVSGFIRAFAGDDRYIVDYLVEEVLQRQPERVRSFLLQTSDPRPVERPAVRCRHRPGRRQRNAGGPGARQPVRRAAGRQAPLVSLSPPLRRRAPRARDGGAARSRPCPAPARGGLVRGARHGGRGDRAGPRRGRSRNRGPPPGRQRRRVRSPGQYASISRWSASLPDEMVRQRPRLALIHAACAIGDRTQPGGCPPAHMSWAEEAIARHRGRRDDSILWTTSTAPLSDPKDWDALKGEVLALKLQVARDLSPEEIAGIAGQALALLPAEKHTRRGMLHLINAGIQMALSDLTLALPNLERGIDEARRAQNPPASRLHPGAPRTGERGDGPVGRRPALVRRGDPGGATSLCRSRLGDVRSACPAGRGVAGACRPGGSDRPCRESARTGRRRRR